MLSKSTASKFSDAIWHRVKRLRSLLRKLTFSRLSVSIKKKDKKVINSSTKCLISVKIAILTPHIIVYHHHWWMFGWYLICRNMSTDYVWFWKFCMDLQPAADPPGGLLVFEVGHHPRKKIHVIRVVFQDQTMYARTSFRGAKTCKIGKKGMFLVIWRILERTWRTN